MISGLVTEEFHEVIEDDRGADYFCAEAGRQLSTGLGIGSQGRSVRRLKMEADRLSLRTKRRLRCGMETGGKPFTRGHLYQLLSNPLYVGEVAHKGQTYSGQHQPIIDREIWDAVQAILSDNAAPRHIATNSKEPSLLVGLLYDETGDRLSPSHATKNGRRYRYYISHRLMQAAREKNDGWRIPAQEIETLIIGALAQFLSNEPKVLDLIAKSHRTPDALSTILGKAKALSGTLASASTCQRRQLVRAIVRRVDVAPGLLQIEINVTGLAGLLSEVPVAEATRALVLDVPFKLRKRGVEAKLIVPHSSPADRKPDAVLVRTVALARYFFEQLHNGQASSIADLAEQNHHAPNEISRIIPLAFLAPDIVTAIIEGRQPVDLTAKRLKRIGDLPRSWHDQRRLLGVVQ